MRTLKQLRKQSFLTSGPSFPPAPANVINHRKRPLGARSGLLPLTVFNKVRNYRSAAKVRALGLYPFFRSISSAQDSEVTIQGRKVLMLGSNSYLGLTNHPKIKEDRKSTRLNSSHLVISYAVFCFKK